MDSGFVSERALEQFRITEHVPNGRFERAQVGHISEIAVTCWS
jgi:hypothetical protein